MNQIKNTQKVMLLVVFALGAIITYIVSFFLPLPYSKASKPQTPGNQMMNHGAHSDNPSSKMNMGNMMHDMAGGLEGKTGADFDKIFLAEMIVHHEGAVAMAKKALAISQDNNVRALSAEIIEAQEKEMGVMKTWLADMIQK